MKASTQPDHDRAVAEVPRASGQPLRELVTDFVNEPTQMPWAIAPYCSAIPTATSSTSSPPRPTPPAHVSPCEPRGLGRPRGRLRLPTTGRRRPRQHGRQPADPTRSVAGHKTDDGQFLRPVSSITGSSQLRV